jgi:Icc-related predicted phosphoesterase
MKLLPCSDQHFEFLCDKQKAVQKLPKADIIAIAGDLVNGPGVESTLNLLCDKYDCVVYTPGNHEFFGEKPPEFLKKFHNIEIDNLTKLEVGSSAKIDGLNFFGCTMWFPYDESAIPYEQYMTDFYVIPNLREFVYDHNRDSINYLKNNIDSDSIVITHHMPSYKSVASQFEGSPLNAFFISPSAEGIILDNQPPLWIHGHTHYPADYTIDSTRVVCNPMGYPMDKSYFNPHLLIEV